MNNMSWTFDGNIFFTKLKLYTLIAEYQITMHCRACVASVSKFHCDIVIITYWYFISFWILSLNISLFTFICDCASMLLSMVGSRCDTNARNIQEQKNKQQQQQSVSFLTMAKVNIEFWYKRSACTRNAIYIYRVPFINMTHVKMYLTTKADSR